MTVHLSEEQLNVMSKKLDSIKLEILRFRASFLSEEELTPEERKEIEEALS